MRVLVKLRHLAASLADEYEQWLHGESGLEGDEYGRWIDVFDGGDALLREFYGFDGCIWGHTCSEHCYRNVTACYPVTMATTALSS